MRRIGDAGTKAGVTPLRVPSARRHVMCHPEKTLNLFGVYTLETGTLVIPGESRGSCEAGARSWTPAFAGERSLVGRG